MCTVQFIIYLQSNRELLRLCSCWVCGDEHDKQVLRLLLLCCVSSSGHVLTWAVLSCWREDSECFHFHYLNCTQTIITRSTVIKIVIIVVIAVVAESIITVVLVDCLCCVSR